MNLEQLKALQAHYKLRADFQHERGNFVEAEAYDDLARALDAQILDLMVQEQEERVKSALVA